jgi:hypothetical protein
MMRWVRWFAVGLAAAVVVAFAIDWVVFNVRGGVTSKVTVSHFLSAPLKNNKEEIDYLGSEEVTCSVSLFPQDGHAPCWYLRRHKNQVTNI